MINYFFSSQFDVCPLILILDSHRNINIVKHLRKRCLRLIYNDKLSSYNKLLQKDGSFLIYHRINQNLATKMFKVKNGLSLKTVVSALLQKKTTKNQYNLRYQTANSFNMICVLRIRKYFISRT